MTVEQLNLDMLIKQMHAQVMPCKDRTCQIIKVDSFPGLGCSLKRLGNLMLKSLCHTSLLPVEPFRINCEHEVLHPCPRCDGRSRRQLVIAEVTICLAVPIW